MSSIKLDPHQSIQAPPLLICKLTQSMYAAEDIKMDMAQNAQGFSKEITEEVELPWYRYGMVWMVILLPMLVVVASSFTIYIAYDNAPDIVPPAITQSK